MKTVVFIMVIIGTISSVGIAQMKEIRGRQYFIQGDYEAHFFITLGTYNTSMHSKQAYGVSELYEYSSSDGAIYFQIGVSAAYYIIDGLSIEPELDLNLSFDYTSITLLGNLCYTFSFPGKNIFPYLKIGYGLSSSKSGDYYNNNLEGSFGSLDHKTINTGAGLKFLYSSIMFLRFEVNYRHLANSVYSFTDLYSSTAVESETSIISLSIGLSVLL